MKKNRGITLIALVVTIIILIILAGVGINLTLGQNGIFNKAKYAKEEYNNAVQSEEEQLNELYAYLQGDKLPENTPDTDAGTPVAMPNGWYTETPNYVSTPDGNVVTKSTKVASVYAVSTGNNETVPVPLGFYYVGGDLSTGVVISDKEADKNKYAGKKEDGTTKDVGKDLVGNQFVWIPCSIDNYVKKEFNSNYYNTNWDRETLSSEEVQIRKYNGFYVARYEAGMSESGFDNLTAGVTGLKNSYGWVWQNTIYSKANASATAKPTSKANEIPWFHADRSTAVEMSSRMYENSSSVISGLITGTMWDIMVQYIATEAEYNSSTWGNYIDYHNLTDCTGKYCTMDSNGSTSVWSDNTTGKNDQSTYVLLTTGSTEQVKKKNMYDVAGNLWEWTTEAATRTDLTENQANPDYNQFVLRGGGFHLSYSTYPACYRSGTYAGDAYTNLGFRVALYLK